MELPISQARELLIELGAIWQSRDERIRTGYDSGLSVSEISRLTGLSRDTIHRVLRMKA